MKSLQDYINTYRKIAENLNIVGDSAEMLIQLLANATYISEVENLSYAKEASLEKASLMSSKIQHCMNEMYSVFRGQCPRAILKFKPTKYFNLNVFDTIVTSNNFKIYYLGYYTGKKDIEKIAEEGSDSIAAIDNGFVYGPKTIYPEENDNIIIGLIAKETYTNEWTTTEDNPYYVEADAENLSNDLWVKLNGDFVDTTRIFSEHITDKKIFDLTIPSFGSRLYVADVLRNTDNINKDTIVTQTNVNIKATWFKYSSLSDYNNSELKRITVKGGEMTSYLNTKDNEDFMKARGFDEEVTKGLLLVDSSDRDTIQSIHYKANRDRFVNSIIRSNSDIGAVLEETFPENVEPNGTSYDFGNDLTIYYVPREGNQISQEKKTDFIKNKKSYFVTDSVKIQEGTKVVANFDIEVILYNSKTDEEDTLNDDISEILSQYENKFEVNLDDKKEEIKSLISKVSNVKVVKNLTIRYNTNDEKIPTNLKNTYFKIQSMISSEIQR